ncbi:MAG: PQQ-binding-like beta-propeller repeat protein [Acidobacteriota bacterium]
MNIGMPGTATPRKPLRLWPAVAIAGIQLSARFALPAISTDMMPYGVIAGIAGGLLLLLWWLFFSRAPWLDRLGAVVAIAVAMVVTKQLVHESIALGAMGMLLPILVIPGLSLAFVASAAATQTLGDLARRVSMVAAIVLACGVWTLFRTGGFTASFTNDLHWRWEATPEDRLLAKAETVPLTPQPAAQPTPEATPALTPAASEPKPALPSPPPAASEPAASEPAAAWPAFRGPGHDGVAPDIRIQTDWSATPPVELWRRSVGPGWSSFAVRGDLIYTQEQRGPNEVVACYRLKTGKPVWMHSDTARFWESNAGAGPRGTPTLGNGRVYTFGATGILNALDARTGTVVWSHDAAADAGTKLPDWGYASSPLLVDGMVIVAVSGRMAAYDAATGAQRWLGPKHGTSYSSPRLLNHAGFAQLLLMSANGASSVAPADGKVLWEHSWNGYPIVQPGLTPDGGILIAANESSGTRRLAVIHTAGEWKVEERWTSKGLKPYFNDFVVHNGHAFGFDGSILSCIELENGTRKWKGGRYGNGQMILLPTQNLLLILSEEGELALVSATPAKFTELARFQALEGKTWNHPALAGDILLVRNGEEMAAFRLALVDASSAPSGAAAAVAH